MIYIAHIAARWHVGYTYKPLEHMLLLSANHGHCDVVLVALSYGVKSDVVAIQAALAPLRARQPESERESYVDSREFQTWLATIDPVWRGAEVFREELGRPRANRRPVAESLRQALLVKPTVYRGHHNFGAYHPKLLTWHVTAAALFDEAVTPPRGGH